MFDQEGGPPWSRRSTLARLLVLVMGWTGVAVADPAAAEALFREGRRLLDEGRYDEACSKLAESQLQDPASGTLINLALCYEKQGRLATAWAEYRAAAVLARKDGRSDRIVTAEQKILELENQVPRLTVHAARLVPGMEARWANIRVGVAGFDTPIPVDPGTYLVTVSAPEHEDFTVSLTIAAKEAKTVNVPELRARALTQADAPVSDPAGPRKAPPAAVARPKAETGTSALPGLVVVGAGAAALGVGAFFGVSSLGAYADAERKCPTHRGCSAVVRNTREEAETKAWIANIALGAGLLATGVGAWLVLGSSAGDERSVLLHVTPAPGGAKLGVTSAL